MDSIEQNMIDILYDLKINHHVLGLKIEFGEEGTTVKEALFLKKIANAAGLDFIIKIGGSEAVKDLYDTKLIGVNSIVAPMIESPYAVKKYVECTKTVFSEEELRKIKLYINIETQYGFKYIEEILNSDFSDCIDGIVLGRTDFARSLDMKKDDVNNEIILDYSKSISLQARKHRKEFIVGGGVSAESIEFFKQMPYITKIETRNIVYNAQTLLDNKNGQESILKGMEFEIMRLKNKKNVLGIISQKDIERIKILESRCVNVLV